MLNRGEWEPEQFGIAGMGKDEIIKVLCQYFRDSLGRTWTVDDLLLHPSDAVRFCQDARFRAGWFDMPEEFILRALRAGEASATSK